MPVELLDAAGRRRSPATVPVSLASRASARLPLVDRGAAVSSNGTSAANGASRWRE